MSAEIAHVVLIDTDGWQVLTDWQMGPYLVGYLADGPEALWEYVTTADSAEFVEPAEWRLVERFDHGGMVIDRVRRELTWFTDGVEMQIPLFRRLYLRVLAKLWPGWRVRWAYQGLDDLLAAVPSRRHTLRRIQPHEHADQPGWRPELTAEVRLPDDGKLPANRSGSYSLLTLRDASGVRAWTFEECVLRTGHLAWRGAALLDRLPDGDLRRGRLATPSAGLHLDTVTDELGYWTLSVVGNLASEMERLWPGMRVSFWQDRHERHAESIADAIALSPIDEAAALRPDGVLGYLDLPRDPVRLFTGNGYHKKGAVADRVTVAVTEVLRELGLVEPNVDGRPGT